MRPRGTVRTGETHAQMVCLALQHDWLPYNVFVISLTSPPTPTFSIKDRRPGVTVEALHMKTQVNHGQKSTSRARLRPLHPHYIDH